MKYKTIAINDDTEAHAENGGFEQAEVLVKCICNPSDDVDAGGWLDAQCPVHFPPVDEFEDDQPTEPRGFWR